VGPRAGLDGRKILSPPGFDPGTSFHVYTLYIYIYIVYTRTHTHIYIQIYIYIYIYIYTG